MGWSSADEGSGVGGQALVLGPALVLLWSWGPALVLGDQGQVQAGLPMLSLLLSPLPCRSMLRLQKFTKLYRYRMNLVTF